MAIRTPQRLSLVPCVLVKEACCTPLCLFIRFQYAFFTVSLPVSPSVCIPSPAACDRGSRSLGQSSDTPPTLPRLKWLIVDRLSPREVSYQPIVTPHLRTQYQSLLGWSQRVVVAPAIGPGARSLTVTQCKCPVIPWGHNPGMLLTQPHTMSHLERALRTTPCKPPMGPIPGSRG